MVYLEVVDIGCFLLVNTVVSKSHTNGPSGRKCKQGFFLAFYSLSLLFFGCYWSSRVSQAFINRFWISFNIILYNSGHRWFYTNFSNRLGIRIVLLDQLFFDKSYFFSKSLWASKSFQNSYQRMYFSKICIIEASDMIF